MAEYIDRADAERAMAGTPLKFNGKLGDYIHISQAIGVIRCVKPADVAPVRHGKWIDVQEKRLFGDHYFLCPNCKSRNGLMISFNFCPNCGAKMDGGENNDKP